MDLPQLMRRNLDEEHAGSQERQCEQRRQRKLPAFRQHDAGNANNGEQIGKQLCHAVGQHILQRVDVADDAR